MNEIIGVVWGPCLIAATSGLVPFVRRRYRLAVLLAVIGPATVIVLPLCAAVVLSILMGPTAPLVVAYLLIWPVALLFFAISFVSFSSEPARESRMHD